MEVYGFTVEQYNALIGLLTSEQQSAFNQLVVRDESNPGSPFYRINDTTAYNNWVLDTLGEEAEFDGFFDWGTFVIGKSQGSGGN